MFISFKPINILRKFQIFRKLRKYMFSSQFKNFVRKNLLFWKLVLIINNKAAICLQNAEFLYRVSLYSQSGQLNKTTAKQVNSVFRYSLDIMSRQVANVPRQILQGTPLGRHTVLTVRQSRSLADFLRNQTIRQLN